MRMGIHVSARIDVPVAEWQNNSSHCIIRHGPHAYSPLTFAIRRTAVILGALSAKDAVWPLPLFVLTLPLGRPALQRTSRVLLRMPGRTRTVSGIVAAMPWQRCIRLAVRQPRRACMPPLCMIVIVSAASTALINGCMLQTPSR